MIVTVGLKRLFASLLSVLVMAGCSSQKEAVQERRPQLSVSESAERDRALQHFIDGSLLEQRGEYARAILEYQDALRYDKNHAIHYALSKCYTRLNKHTHAIEAGREAVRLAPDNIEYRRTLANAYLLAFDLDAAAKELEELVKRDSSHIESWYNLARVYQARKPLQALEVYEGILSRFGEEWDVLLQIADLNNTLGQFDKAAEALRRMLLIDPGNQELRRTLAQTYVRAERYDDAITIYDELRKRYPDNLEYVADLASLHLNKKEYALAADEFERLLADDSINIDAKLRVGEMFLAQTEKDSAVIPLARRLFEKVKTIHPDDWRPYWFLGIIGGVSRDDSLAIPNLTRVTELASWNADGWVYLASVYLDKNSFAATAEVLGRAVKVVPEDFRVNFLLGVALSRLERNMEAIARLERAREINPKDMGALAQLALIYDQMKKYEESDRLYEEGLRMDSTYHLILNNYGYSLADRGVQLDRALGMSQRAIEAQPENSSYLDTYGWVHFRLGNYDQAERYILKAIEHGDASAVVHEHLGDVYYMQGRQQEALQQWRKALELDADNLELQRKITRGSI
jgi:tetratricopeptide (TPR) repeat protein